MNGKRRLLLAVVLILLAVVILCALFWDTIALYVAPKVVLTSALTDAWEKLEERTEGSPLRILAEGYDPDGKNTTLLKLQTSDNVLGQVDYDMTVQTDLNSNQVLASGEITTGGKGLGVEVYLDSDFMALTSGDLLQGGYYGITYDTFSTDIQKFSLLTLLAGESTIAKWEASVSALQEYMNRSHALPQLPELTEEDVRLLMLGILALKSDTTTETVTIGGESLKCRTVTYSATGAQVGEILKQLMETGAAEKGTVTASFYLYENTLVRLDISGKAGTDSVELSLILGKDAAVNDLSLTMSKTEKGEQTSLDLTASTRRTGARYTETITIGGASISYDFHTSTGDMTLNLPDRTGIVLNLTEGENGFVVKTQDFAKLLGFESTKTFDCMMTVSKGTSIAIPGYKNLDQWSWEDLLVLLSGFGSMLGLNLSK